MSDLPEAKRRTHLTPAEKETLAKQIAAGAAVGDSVQAMAQRLNISRPAVSRILNAPTTQDLIKKIGDDAVRGAKSVFRARAEALAPKVFARLEQLIESESGRDAAEGIKLYYRTINMEGKDESSGGGTLIVQLPGGDRQEKAIEVRGL
jgi:hypothetical protein